MTKITLQSFLILFTLTTTLFSLSLDVFASEYVQGKVQATAVVKGSELLNRLKFTGAVATHLVKLTNDSQKIALDCVGSGEESVCTVYFNREGKIVFVWDRSLSETPNSGTGVASITPANNEIEINGVPAALVKNAIRGGEDISCEQTDKKDPFATRCKFSALKPSEQKEEASASDEW